VFVVFRGLPPRFFFFFFFLDYGRQTLVGISFFILPFSLNLSTPQLLTHSTTLGQRESIRIARGGGEG